MHRIKEWWRSVIEPPRQRPFYFVIYMIIMTLPGIATLVSQPVTVEAMLGPGLTTAWSLLLTVGGAMGAAMVLTRWWAMERAGISFIITGLLIYLASTIGAQALLGGSRWATMGLILAGIVAMIKRWSTIRIWTWAPPGSDD